MVATVQQALKETDLGPYLNSAFHQFEPPKGAQNNASHSASFGPSCFV